MNRYHLYGVVAGSTLGLLIVGGLTFGVRAVGAEERPGVNAASGGEVLLAQDWRRYNNWGQYSNYGLFDRLGDRVRGALRNELGQSLYGPYYRGGYGRGNYYSPYYGYSGYGRYGYRPYYGGYSWW